MKRLVIIGVVLIMAAFSYVTLQDKPAQISLVNAKATMGGHGAGAFMVGLEIENAGPPDELLGVTSPSGNKVLIMNPGMMGAPLIIPGEGSATLAMDGAHLMLTADAADFEEGGFIPVTLNFRNAGPLSTRVQNAGAAMMSHDMSNGVTELVAPDIEIVPVGNPDKDGFGIEIKVENFNFVRTADDAVHVANEGHAHAYLNGLKLGRVYEPSFNLGALSSGDYSLEISLNTNDHQPYFNNGKPVSDLLKFTIP